MCSFAVVEVDCAILKGVDDLKIRVVTWRTDEQAMQRNAKKASVEEEQDSRRHLSVTKVFLRLSLVTVTLLQYSRHCPANVVNEGRALYTEKALCNCVMACIR
eukprot:scaffold3240_cov197-Alexandrium_tamarense.AAC.37